MKLPLSVGTAISSSCVGGRADLLDVEHRVAVDRADPAVLDGDPAGVLLEPVGGALEDGLGIVLGHQEVGERPGGRVTVGGDGEVVLRRVRGAGDRGADDLVDRRLLVVAGAVAVVGEGRLRGQRDREDHEEGEHQRAGHEVLGRQRAPGGVRRHEDERHHPDDDEEQPRLLADQGRREGDRGADDDAEEQHLDQDRGYVVAAGPVELHAASRGAEVSVGSSGSAMAVPLHGSSGAGWWVEQRCTWGPGRGVRAHRGGAPVGGCRRPPGCTAPGISRRRRSPC